ncbi:MAG: metal-sulfur cluster assembly factor [Balneolaceae bacterium]|nr:metal-sulfur cluster assembly factor [Balneolaceae bacterium]
MDSIEINRQDIVQKLREVIDPELGVNIVDLGLVYGIYREGDKIVVEYTVTTPGCPMRRYLQQKVEKTLNRLDAVEDFETRLVWEPEWSVDMIVPDVEFFSVPPPQLNQQ